MNNVKKNIKLLLLSCFLSLCISYSYAEENLRQELVFGTSVYDYDKPYQNKIKSAALQTEKILEEIFDDKIHVSIQFYDDKYKMINDFYQFNNINILFTNTVFYYANREKIKEVSDDFLVFAKHDKLDSYILLANKHTNIKSLKDIKGKIFTTISEEPGYAVWLDYLSLKNNAKGYKQLIHSESNALKENRVILNVYFEKADFTVVRRSVYEDMLALNPSLAKNLVVITESDKIFLYGLCFMHKNISNQLKDKIYSKINGELLHKKLNYIYKLLGQSKIVSMYTDDLKEVENFYHEYYRLKEQY